MNRWTDRQTDRQAGSQSRMIKKIGMTDKHMEKNRRANIYIYGLTGGLTNRQSGRKDR